LLHIGPAHPLSSVRSVQRTVHDAQGFSTAC
jgi:hypothetical protein